MTLEVADLPVPRLRAGPAGLTPREVEVLALIARGASTRQVARTLGVTPKTAGTHIERIYLKTGASTRSTATLFALPILAIHPRSAELAISRPMMINSTADSSRSS